MSMPDDLESNPEKTLPIRNPVTLKLSGRYFDKGVNIHKSERSGRTKNARIRGIYTINIDLKINPEFLDCDLKDEIELFLKKNNKIIFRGIINEFFVDGKKAIVEAQGIEAKLDYVSIIGLEASQYLNFRDLASLLISPVEELRVGNTPDIPDTTSREFIVVVPIKNLVLNEDCNIGNVKFYTNFNIIDDKIIAKTDIGKKVQDWNSFRTRARITVKASEFRNALIEGYNEISTAIDLITLRNDLSFPKLEINGRYEFPHFYYDKLVAQVTIPTWVYCRENDTYIWAILNLNFPKENALSLQFDAHGYFGTIDQLFSKLLCCEDRTQNEKRLLMALHWLRRSIQNGDNKDKMLDLWTAMEFVMSGTKVNQLFCDEQIDLITQLINSNLESLTLSDPQKDALIKKIKTLNEAPLMTRINALKEELEINLAGEEIELIKTARKKRNKIIHGEDIDIYERELNKLRSIIERLLVGKISLLDRSAK